MEGRFDSLFVKERMMGGGGQRRRVPSHWALHLANLPLGVKYASIPRIMSNRRQFSVIVNRTEQILTPICAVPVSVGEHPLTPAYRDHVVTTIRLRIHI